MAYTLWLTTTEADTYLLEERVGASDYWSSATDKPAALAMAQKTIVSAGLWEFTEPDSGVEYADDIKEAICEQALFLIANPDISFRSALQAQDVLRAGVVDEQYKDKKHDWRTIVPVCQESQDRLNAYRTRGMGFKFTAPD